MFAHLQYDGNTISVTLNDTGELIVKSIAAIDQAALNTFARRAQPYMSMIAAAVMYIQDKLPGAKVTTILDPQSPDGTIH